MTLSYNYVLSLWFGVIKFYSFGASQKHFPYALSYLRIYAVGTVFIQLTVGLNLFYQHSRLCAEVWCMMTFTSIGGILNIILDPILYLMFLYMNRCWRRLCNHYFRNWSHVFG